MYAEFPHLAQIDQIAPAGIAGVRDLAGRAIKTDSAKLHSPIGDFYLTNPIARASAIMAECSQMQAGLQAGGGVGPMEFIAAAANYLLGIPIFGWGDQVGFVYKGLLLPRRAADLHGLHPSRRPQDLGGGAGAPRPERRRPVRPACSPSRTC